MENVELQKRARRARIFWIVAAAVVVLLIGMSLLPKSLDVDIAKIDRGDVRVEVVDQGRTRMHDIYIVGAPITGRVLRVDVEPGDSVKAGDVLARMSAAAAGFLDTRSYLQSRAAVTAAEAQQRSAAAELTLAEQENRRNLELFKSHLVSKASVDQSQAQYQAAKAGDDAAKAEVERARSALLSADRVEKGVVVVRSPVTGRVLFVPQKSEAVIAAGTPIVQVGDPSHVEVIAEFLSQDAIKMRHGAAAQIENWGGPPLPAVVDRVEPVAHTKISALGVEEQRTNVILQFAPEAADKPVAHDFRVNARVVVAEAKHALRAPLGALFRNGEGWAVYKVVDGKAIKTVVQAAEADTNYRAITAGLSEGDEVVVYPGASITDGVKVKER